MPTSSPYGYDYPDYYTNWIQGGAKHPVWDVEGVAAAKAAGIQSYAAGYGDPNGGWTSKTTPWGENINYNAQGQESSIWNPAYSAFQQNWLATRPFSGQGSQTAPNVGDAGFGLPPGVDGLPGTAPPPAPPGGDPYNTTTPYTPDSSLPQNFQQQGVGPDAWQTTILNRAKKHGETDENKKMRLLIRNTVLQSLAAQKNGGRYGGGAGWGGGM